MIKSLAIENFRSLKAIEMHDSGRITLISGRNNVGKSTILEALFLFMDHSAPDSFMKINSFRGQNVINSSTIWEPLFNKLDTDKNILIDVGYNDHHSILKYSKDNDYLPYKADGLSEDLLAQFRTSTKNSYSLLFSFSDYTHMTSNYTYQEKGHFSLNGASVLREIKTSLPGNEIRIMMPTQFINSALIRVPENVLNGIGKMELSGKKDSIISVLQELDPSIEDILTLAVDGIIQLYIRVKGQLIPLQYAGDGVMKLLSICLAILERKNGLVLIDELETGFHYSMYDKLWKVIDKISAESNCQIIATTHSYELILSASKSINATEDFVYYRMGRANEETKLYRYDHSSLIDAIEADMEVR